MVHLGCMRQQPFELPANVAFGSISTELGYQGHVRFAPGCDRIADITERQFRAKNQKWERAL
jgi:hypothetical protein